MSACRDAGDGRMGVTESVGMLGMGKMGVSESVGMLGWEDACVSVGMLG